MPPVQENYSEYMREAVPGFIGTMIPATLISRTVETVAGIGFGVGVFQGADDRGCIADTADDTKNFVGITVRERSAGGSAGNLEGNKFSRYESARIMTKGHVWVTVSANVVAGDDVTVNADGTFGTAAVSATVRAVNGRYDTSAQAGGLALVRMV